MSSESLESGADATRFVRSLVRCFVSEPITLMYKTVVFPEAFRKSSSLLIEIYGSILNGRFDRSDLIQTIDSKYCLLMISNILFSQNRDIKLLHIFSNNRNVITTTIRPSRETKFDAVPNSARGEKKSGVIRLYANIFLYQSTRMYAALSPVTFVV